MGSRPFEKVFQLDHKMKKIIVLLAVLTSCSVYAQPVAAPNAFDRFMDITTGAGKQTIQYSRDGVPLLSPGVPTINTDGGNPVASSTGSFRNPSGNPVPVTATARIPPAEVGRAVGRVAAAVGRTLGPIGVGIAVIDLARELGLTATKTDTGFTYAKPDPAICSVAPCFTFRIDDALDAVSGHSSMESACSAYAAIAAPRMGRTPYTTSVNGVPFAAGTFECRISFSGGAWTKSISQTQVAPRPAVLIASNQQELIDAVAARSGWPANSTVRNVLALDNAPVADKIKTLPGVVTGPATSAGTSTTTNNATNNTTKVETTTHNHTYAGPVVTTISTTTNNTTNNTTGAVSESTTIISTPVAPALPPPAPAEVVVCGLPNTPACKIDETGTAPNAGTTYDAPKAAIDVAKTSVDTAIGGAASIAAPAWSFSFQLPTGCAPYITGIKGVVLNVCQYQSTMHALLSAIWAAATAFAMIGMVGRTIREA